MRGGLEALLDELQATFGGVAKVFRQQRDLRFTPDRTPYKTHTYGVLGGAAPGGGHYAELSASGLYAGAGYHELGRDQLERFRAAVSDDATARQPFPSVVRRTIAQPRAGFPGAGG